MSVEAVTNLAVMLEMFLACLHDLRSIRGWILPIFSADLHLLDFGGKLRFRIARFVRLAGRQCYHGQQR